MYDVCMIHTLRISLRTILLPGRMQRDDFMAKDVIPRGEILGNGDGGGEIFLEEDVGGPDSGGRGAVNESLSVDFEPFEGSFGNCGEFPRGDGREIGDDRPVMAFGPGALSERNISQHGTSFFLFVTRSLARRDEMDWIGRLLDTHPLQIQLASRCDGNAAQPDRGGSMTDDVRVREFVRSDVAVILVLSVPTCSGGFIGMVDPFGGGSGVGLAGGYDVGDVAVGGDEGKDGGEEGEDGVECGGHAGVVERLMWKKSVGEGEMNERLWWLCADGGLRWSMGRKTYILFFWALRLVMSHPLHSTSCSQHYGFPQSRDRSGSAKMKLASKRQRKATYQIHLFCRRKWTRVDEEAVRNKMDMSGHSGVVARQLLADL